MVANGGRGRGSWGAAVAGPPGAQASAPAGRPSHARRAGAVATPLCTFRAQIELFLARAISYTAC
eukprot:scaffold9004_cov112-Isochrysis_galbana.AAC.3